MTDKSHLPVFLQKNMGNIEVAGATKKDTGILPVKMMRNMCCHGESDAYACMHCAS